MKSIRTVNLLWEYKTRASYPVSRYAVSDDGSVMLAMPRPLEFRAFDLTSIDTAQTKRTGSGFSVETLVKLDVSSASGVSLGMTSDDLYLISEGKKNRFLGDKHLLYVDSSLSRDGKILTAGFSDMSGTSFCIAFGDISGEAHWLHEVSEPISCIALASDGTRVVIGYEFGRISMSDASRRDVWIFEQNEKVRSLAVSKGGRFSAYGTIGGVVGLIDEEGTRRWEATLPGSVSSLALSEDGEVCAALCESADGAALIYCLGNAGQISWEYDPERAFHSLALSGNGRFLAVSGKDGTHLLHEIIFSEGAESVSVDVLSTKSANPNGYQPDGVKLEGTAGELQNLRTRLESSPGDMVTCEKYFELSKRFTDAQLEKVRALGEQRDFSSAIAVLAGLRQALPESHEVVTFLSTARMNFGQSLLDEARSHLQSDNLVGAEDAILQGLYCNPLSLDLRREYVGLNSRRAVEGDREADRLITEGEIEAALAKMELSQSILPSQSRLSKMNWAQNVLEFNQGMSFYNDKRYREAVFQFKKVLARDPNHSEARRYLAFAKCFDNDANNAIDDRFSRLEGLE